MTATTVVVMAKAPLPGRAKTRLTPPCSPTQAAALAEAALLDTLDAVRACSASRRVLAFDGDPRPWPVDGFEIRPQEGDGLDERLAAVFAASSGPTFLVGMDTPQVTAADIDGALACLDGAGAGAVLGPAADGGFWAIGMSQPDPSALAGVPMSRADTGRLQHRRLAALGLPVALLPTFRDVDTFDDARAVAALCPATRFAARFGAVEGALR